jgi:hypothetical protein
MHVTNEFAWTHIQLYLQSKVELERRPTSSN